MSTGPCEAVQLFLGVDAGVCGKPGGLYRGICQHEHVRDGYLCADHVADIELGACKECWQHPDRPHSCGVHIAPLAGAA